VTVYKIRNKQGKYSTGGSYPRFTKAGKVWTSLGALKQHLDLVTTPRVYKDCELVELLSEEHATPLLPVVRDRVLRRVEANEALVADSDGWMKRAHERHLADAQRDLESLGD
jgi:hypothetical protein